MQPQLKAAGDASARTVAGIAAVFGNVDLYGDVIMPGAFVKTIAQEFEAERSVRHLWQHSFFDPPTAVVTKLSEVTREELPEAVLEKAPEALGGLYIERDYLDTARGNEILASIKAGAINQMSFGFDAVAFDLKVTVDTQGNEKQIRQLNEVKLYDTSDVLWGANAATVATDAKDMQGLLSQLFLSLKSGRRNANTDESLINQIHNITVALGTTKCKGITSADDAEEDDEQKAALVLTQRRAAFRRLQFETLIGS